MTCDANDFSNDILSMRPKRFISQNFFVRLFVHAEYTFWRFGKNVVF